MPNGTAIRSIGTSRITFPHIPESASLGHVAPGLHANSLLSIGKLCNAGCVATFRNTDMDVSLDDQVVLRGERTANGLWHIPPPANLCNLAWEDSVPSMIAYYHAAAGFPCAKTWCWAIDRGFFISWPGLTADAVRRHLPKSAITDAGHLDQARQGRRSTTRPPRSGSVR